MKVRPGLLKLDRQSLQHMLREENPFISVRPLDFLTVLFLAEGLPIV